METKSMHCGEAEGFLDIQSTETTAMEMDIRGVLSGKFVFKTMPDGSADKTKVICVYCGREMSYHRSTSSLKYHLLAKHNVTADAESPAHIYNNISTPAHIHPYPTALISASKYKSGSLEQLAKEEAIARWILRTGLPVTTIEDDDFVLMMETADKRLTVPKKARISNLIEKHHECQKHGAGPSMQTDVFNSLIIKMEESPDDYDEDEDYNDIASAIPSANEPRDYIGHGKDGSATSTLKDGGSGGHIHHTQAHPHHHTHPGAQNPKSSNPQAPDPQLSLFLAESRREFEEMMSRYREGLELEDRPEPRRVWLQEWQRYQATMTTLTQSLLGNHISPTPPCGLLGNHISSSSPYGPLSGHHVNAAQAHSVPATAPPRSVSAPAAPALTAPQREVSGRLGSSTDLIRGAKRVRAPSPPGVLEDPSKDICEEQHFLFSLLPALKRLDSRKKSLVRIKIMQFLHDVEFSNN